MLHGKPWWTTSFLWGCCRFGNFSSTFGRSFRGFPVRFFVSVFFFFGFLRKQQSWINIHRNTNRETNQTFGTRLPCGCRLLASSHPFFMSAQLLIVTIFLFAFQIFLFCRVFIFFLEWNKIKIAAKFKNNNIHTNHFLSRSGSTTLFTRFRQLLVSSRINVVTLFSSFFSLLLI